MQVHRLAAYFAAQQARPSAKAATVPLVSFVIVNHRRWPETAALVRQLVDAESFFRDRIEVLIVDNASPPDPRGEALARMPGVRLHRLTENRGFSAGVNAGFHLSRGRWLLVLNPDLAVDPGFVDAVCAAALELRNASIQGKRIGVLGFQLRNSDGSLQRSAGPFPTLRRTLCGLLRRRSRRKYWRCSPRQRQLVPWVTGSCLLIRRACLRRLGGFDEDFFLYYEDVDFCRRAAEQGWAVGYEPAIQATHLDPLQNRKPTALMRVITRYASLIYFAKHQPRWQVRGLAWIIATEAGVRGWWAWWRGRDKDAWLYREMRAMCRAVSRRQPLRANKQFDAVLRGAGLKE